MKILNDKVSLILKKMLERKGFAAFSYRPNYHYVPKYYGRSASKQADLTDLPVFGELAEKVIRDKHTYLYYDRLYTIYQIILNMKSCLKGISSINTAELGVYRGGGSYFAASAAARLGLSINHHCFDTFEGHVTEDIDGSLEPRQKPGSFYNTSFEDVRKYLREFPNVSVYKGRFQDTCQALEGMKFGFVHLDMDIYSPTIYALEFFEEKMLKGGVILLDDYGFSSCPGIEKAAGEFAANIGAKYFGMPMLTGQFVLVRL